MNVNVFLVGMTKKENVKRIVVNVAVVNPLTNVHKTIKTCANRVQMGY